MLALFRSADTLDRIRRIKCGEEKPSCVKCLKSGWKCEGYGYDDFKRQPAVEPPIIGSVPDLYLSAPTPRAEPPEEEAACCAIKDEASSNW